MPEQTFDKGAEQAVLSCCIHSPTARAKAREHLSKEDFCLVAHETIWAAMAELDVAERAVDPVSVLSALAGNREALEAMPDITTTTAIPDNVGVYAETVRGWAIRRRLARIAASLGHAAMDPTRDPYGLTSDAVTRFTELRDTGITGEVQSRLLADLLAEVDEPYDWVINGLMERRDRLVLTGQEGLGKVSWPARSASLRRRASIPSLWTGSNQCGCRCWTTRTHGSRSNEVVEGCTTSRTGTAQTCGATSTSPHSSGSTSPATRTSPCCTARWTWRSPT